MRYILSVLLVGGVMVVDSVLAAAKGFSRPVCEYTARSGWRPEFVERFGERNWYRVVRPPVFVEGLIAVETLDDALRVARGTLDLEPADTVVIEMRVVISCEAAG